MKSGLFLFIYSVFKAFLPLPSLEAVLLPLCLLYPDKAFFYAMLSGFGTCIGGHIGYEISNRYGRKAALRFVSEEMMASAVEKFQKMGYLYIIVGSLSPFPDFILSYAAGMLKMNRWVFMLLDGGCRWLRSLLLIYFSSVLNEYFHFDRYMIILSVLMLCYFMGRYFLKKRS